MSTARRLLHPIALTGLALLLAGCGGSDASSASPAASTVPSASAEPDAASASAAPAARPAVPSTQDLCALAGPGDFTAAAVQVSGAPSSRSGGPGSAYCVYAGRSGATGGVEFDAFVDADATTAATTYATVTAGRGSADDPMLAGELGVDEARLVPATQTDPEYAFLAARAGRFSFMIAVPVSREADQQLKAIAGLVLLRAGGLR